MDDSSVSEAMNSSILSSSKKPCNIALVLGLNCVVIWVNKTQRLEYG